MTIRHRTTNYTVHDMCFAHSKHFTLAILGTIRFELDDEILWHDHRAHCHPYDQYRRDCVVVLVTRAMVYLVEWWQSVPNI